MIFYHIPTSTEYDDHGAFANKLTHCGEPWKLDLSQFDSVPVVRDELLDGQIHDAPVLETTRYYYAAIARSIEQQIEIKAILYTDSIQSYLDSAARACKYDSILSLCSYCTSTDTAFHEEGMAGCAWRDACWRTGYQILDDVKNGLRTIPTEAELLAEMPPIPATLRMAAAARDGVTLEEDTTYGAENQTLWTTIKGWFGF